MTRGALIADNRSDITDIYDRIYFESSAHDRRIVTGLLSDAQIKERVPLSLPYPPQPPNLSNLEPGQKLNKWAFVSQTNRRLQRYEDTLAAFLRMFASLENAFLMSDHLALEQQASSLRRNFGYSVAIIRKLLSIISISHGDKKVIGAFEPYFSELRSSRHIIYRAFESGYDPERDYIETRRKIVALCHSSRLTRTSRGILRHHFSPVMENEDEWFNRARAHAAYSLPDILMFVLDSRRIKLWRHTWPNSNDAIIIPPTLTDLYYNGCSHGVGPLLRRILNDRGGSEFPLLNHANAWLNDEAVAREYGLVEHALGMRLDGIFNAAHADPTNFRGSFEGITSTLLDEPSESYGPVFRSQTENNELGSESPSSERLFFDTEYLRTIQLIAYVANGKSLASLSGFQLLQLMNNTTSVALLLTPSELDGALPPSTSDPLYELIRSTLIYGCDPSIVHDFELREATQNFVKQCHQGDIVSALQFIHAHAPNVSEFYVSVWTEGFLVQCFRLYRSAYDVNNARAQLLDWYGGATKSISLVERSRSLALENKLTLIRHDIDSQRLYVDLGRFNQWLNENLGQPLRRVLESRITQETPDQKVDLRDSATSIISPEFAIAQIVNEAFLEFCSNKTYGIDSYVGRRIRHGTFSGTLHKGVKDVIDEIVSQLPNDDGIFSPKLASWLSDFHSEVKRFANQKLQIKSSQKPEGLIAPHVGSINKAGALRFAVEEVKYRLFERHSISEAIDALSQACWILIDPDLLAVRRELERWRRDRLVLTRDHFNRGLELHDEENARLIVRRVNERIDQLVHQTAAWFATPKEVTPSATIHELFLVVRNEVADQVPGFDPVVLEPASGGARIVGHRYQYIYDALYVIVHNAAKHGKARGVLELKVREWTADGFVKAVVSIRSELADGPACRRSIEDAMKAPVDDALVNEGSTGIRKLRTLASTKGEISGVEVAFVDEEVVFSFQLSLAAL